MSKVNIDLSGASVISARVVVPTGNYPVQIVECEPKETKKKGGYYLEMKYKILSGEHEGVVLTDRLNIQNENEDAMRIGLSVLKTILTVSGHKNPNKLADTNEAIGLKLNLYVEEQDSSFVKDGKTIETTENVFKGYYELDTEKASTEPKKASKPKATPAPKAEAAEVAEESSDEADDAPAPAPEAAKFPWMK